MTKYIIHRAGANERWDNTAYKYFQNCYDIQKIIQNNPQTAITPEITEGETIKIPIEEGEKEADKTQLPIWKQQ